MWKRFYSCKPKSRNSWQILGALRIRAKTDINKVTKGFSSFLKAEKEALSKICVDIKLDNVNLKSTITTQLNKLKADTTIENKIMDALAEQTHKARILTENLKNAKYEVLRLQGEKCSVKACNSKIHQRLLRIV
ncbi:unnamed protein product [Lactuca saligna]|uniref:Uncharacterized protein n=1 Tax=Lactuca saligna TaxID=75948 RepID=A0AA36EFL7_LACSI|nr:unnamed protein product [Lactuca saligna]